MVVHRSLTYQLVFMTDHNYFALVACTYMIGQSVLLQMSEQPKRQLTPSSRQNLIIHRVVMIPECIYDNTTCLQLVYI